MEEGNQIVSKQKTYEWTKLHQKGWFFIGLTGGCKIWQPRPSGSLRGAGALREFPFYGERRRKPMKVNWKVRLKNKTFWLTAIPALLLLGSQVLAVFGISWDYTPLAQQLSAICGTVFGLLALLGVVNDPTTSGVSDSTQALTYQNPKRNYVELTKK